MAHDGENSDPVDFSRIQDTSDGDVEFEQELFGVFLDDCGQRITQLRCAFNNGAWDDLRREAHTIKGACSNIGTTRMQDIAMTIEHVSDGDAPTICPDKIGELEVEFGHVKMAINDYLSKL